MKIEVGESLILSWLKHTKKCQVVQLNWKPSVGSWDIFMQKEVTEIAEEIDDYFNREFEINILKKNASINQIILQGEIDVLGMEIQGMEVEQIYVVEVAFHEYGLNYGNKKETVARVIRKFVRSAISIMSFFGTRQAEIIFASPKINNSILSPLNEALDSLNNRLRKIHQCDFSFQVICNEEFRTKIYQPVLHASNEVSDTNELFLRSLQMIKLFEKKRKRPMLKNSQKNSNAEAKDNNASPGELKIGELVRNSFEKLVANEELKKEMIEKLQDSWYSKERMGIHFPVLRKVHNRTSIPEQRKERGYDRYWAEPVLEINGEAYLLCNDWYERNRESFMSWLREIKRM